MNPNPHGLTREELWDWASVVQERSRTYKEDTEYKGETIELKNTSVYITSTKNGGQDDRQGPDKRASQ